MVEEEVGHREAAGLQVGRSHRRLTQAPHLVTPNVYSLGLRNIFFYAKKSRKSRKSEKVEKVEKKEKVEKVEKVEKSSKSRKSKKSRKSRKSRKK